MIQITSCKKTKPKNHHRFKNYKLISTLILLAISVYLVENVKILEK